MRGVRHKDGESRLLESNFHPREAMQAILTLLLRYVNKLKLLTLPKSSK